MEYHFRNLVFEGGGACLRPPPVIVEKIQSQAMTLFTPKEI